MKEGCIDSKEYARGYLAALEFCIDSLWGTDDPDKTVQDLVLSRKVVEIYLKNVVNLGKSTAEASALSKVGEQNGSNSISNRRRSVQSCNCYNGLSSCQ